MTHEEFIQLVQANEFLGADRQNVLIANSPWMSAKEREMITGEINLRRGNIEKNNEAMVAEMDRIQGAILDFGKEEIPKLRKEQEVSEAESSQEEAERLLDEFK